MAAGTNLVHFSFSCCARLEMFNSSETLPPPPPLFIILLVQAAFTQIRFVIIQIGMLFVM